VWSSDYYFIILSGEVVVKIEVIKEIKFKNDNEFEEFLFQNRYLIIRHKKIPDTYDELRHETFKMFEEAFHLQPNDGFGDLILHNRRNMYCNEALLNLSQIQIW